MIKQRNWKVSYVWQNRPGKTIRINGAPFRIIPHGLKRYGINWDTFTIRGLTPVNTIYGLSYAKLTAWNHEGGYRGQEGSWLTALAPHWHILGLRFSEEERFYLIVWPSHRCSSMPEKFIAFEVPKHYLEHEVKWKGEHKSISMRKPTGLHHVDQNKHFTESWSAYSPTAVQKRGTKIYSWGEDEVDVLDLYEHQHYRGYANCQHEFKEIGGTAMFEHKYRCIHCGSTHTNWSD